MVETVTQTQLTLAVTPAVLFLSAPLTELFETLKAIFLYGDGLGIAVISVVLYLIGFIGNLKKSPEEDEANRATGVSQADTTPQDTTATDQSHDPIVEEALNEVAADMDTEDMGSSEYGSSGEQRCSDCGDIAQPDSEYCSHCERNH